MLSTFCGEWRVELQYNAPHKVMEKCSHSTTSISSYNDVGNLPIKWRHRSSFVSRPIGVDRVTWFALYGESANVGEVITAIGGWWWLLVLWSWNLRLPVLLSVISRRYFTVRHWFMVPLSVGFKILNIYS